MNENTIKMWWWSETYSKYWFLPKINFTEKKENFGDVLGPYIVTKLSGKKIEHTFPNSPFSSELLISIGSILKHSSPKCTVWGSGIISKKDKIKGGKFLAVRGKYTRDHLLSLGFECPEVYGDPGIIIPLLYKPKLVKKYRLGIIPHIVDLKKIKEKELPKDILVINLHDSIEKVIDDILQCENIISSSLHGVIISHSYQIPAIWIEFSKKLFGDGVKFADYFSSMNLKEYQPDFIDIQADFSTEKHINKIEEHNESNLPALEIFKKRQEAILSVFPYPIVVSTNES